MIQVLLARRRITSLASKESRGPEDPGSGSWARRRLRTI